MDLFECGKGSFFNIIMDLAQNRSSRHSMGPADTAVDVYHLMMIQFESLSMRIAALLVDYME